MGYNRIPCGPAELKSKRHPSSPLLLSPLVPFPLPLHQELVSVYQNGGEKWRAMSTTKAITALRKWPKEITSYEVYRHTGRAHSFVTCTRTRVKIAVTFGLVAQSTGFISCRSDSRDGCSILWAGQLVSWV